MKRKLIVWLMTLAMLLTLLPQTALFAAATGSGGTASDPWVIKDATDWVAFAESVTNGATYEGQYVKLSDDFDNSASPITVSAGRADDQSNCFMGDFDGNGRTLTMVLSASSNSCAPFLSAKNATIHDLKLAGTINTSAKYGASLVGKVYGSSSTITNCLSTVEITGTISGDGTHGGFVGENNADDLMFKNCVFKGSLLGENATSNGGFVGWTNQNVEYDNCLFAPAALTMRGESSATFNRNGHHTLNKAYYLTALGDAQGIHAFATEADPFTKPVTAADDEIYYVQSDTVFPWSYLDETGRLQLKNADEFSVMTSNMTELSAGWYAVTANTEIGSRVTCTGDVRLVLFDGVTLTASWGITVEEGNSLTVYAQSTDAATMGALRASGSKDDNAGIGASKGNNAGAITINGGAVSAGGGKSAAGIGGTYDCDAGTITVNGGTVNASGGAFAAAIGGGEGAAGTITINSGTVNAAGGYESAGIGGGNGSAGGTITINGGTVTANGGTSGTGIGGGDRGAGGTITINGGTVNATGGRNGAGIGGGTRGSGGTVTINGGSVRATGGKNASGIGGGMDGTGGEIFLSWTDMTDSITATYNGTVTRQKDFFILNSNRILSDLENVENSMLDGQTLVPRCNHRLRLVEGAAPTCVQEGAQERWRCTVCSRSFSDENGTAWMPENSWILPANGHSMTEHAAIAPTCTTDGNSAWWSCSVCGKYFSDENGENEITEGSWFDPATGHSMVEHAAVAPTCTADGNTAYWSCSACRKYFLDTNGENEIAENSWLIASLGGHTLTFHAAVPESDTEAGNTAYWSCSACGKYFSDEDGTQEIPKNSWILSAYYLDASGDLQKRSSGSYTPVTGNTTTLTTGWYAVKYDVEIGSRISCNGDVHLILFDGVTLTVPKGITVSEGNSLTVYAQSTDASTMGAISISAPALHDAGIGGISSVSAGVITINGGSVQVTGGKNAAGIGGTYHGSAGTVTVNGGMVTATGGQNGAAIGGGIYGVGGTVTINGGTVHAIGGVNGSGIGGGFSSGGGGGTLSLSWTSENDSVTASSYTGTVTLQKVFTDGTNIYDAGVITNLSALAGKTLRKPEYFTVWWKDDDGTPLETDENVPYGTTPVYHGQTPVKPYDTSVAFSGWSPEITAATSNATYTAVYNSVVPVGSYIIYVNTPDNVTLTLVVNEDDTVNSVKAKIQGLLGTVTQRQSLIFAGKVLEDGRILGDYNIQNESTLRLVYHNPFTGHSLSLEGEVGLNFYVSLTDEEIDSGAKVNFSWTVESAEKTDSVTLTAADRTDDGYKASVPLPVAEMTYDVTATVVVDGVELATDTYSVKEYADTILSDDYKTAYLAQNHSQEDYTKLENLIKTMLIYGAKAQINFERNTDNLADEGLSYTMQKVTVDMIPSTACDMTEGLDAYGLQYAGTTLVYLAKTSMRHYYTVVDRNKFNAIKDDITFNGEKVSYQTKDGKIYFELKNIAAADLDTVYTLRIGTNEYQSSGLDYVRNCLSASNAPYNTKQLVMATYWYNQAANAYFGR